VVDEEGIPIALTREDRWACKVDNDGARCIDLDADKFRFSSSILPVFVGAVNVILWTFVCCLVYRKYKHNAITAKKTKAYEVEN